ncbi:general transcription factor IIF subunit 1 isoform X1 [Alligator mississippiensis]|uniref:general transcription factor IIF subunit 1 isoform X1 n=3 Tax=Alligator mississippiensis TaxID=8496 RepID=UPI002877683A|nr:general transcription factor IIF subunit 1 isoform X1 [Alligator mississippiensis]XP_059588301.1 general transcription factor IIF subunit 1 isoform X1 [Alligator mississippiensis]
MTSLGTSSQSVTEYVVRVPNHLLLMGDDGPLPRRNTTKKYNIMAFNAADKVNFTSWQQAKMERDLSNKKIYQEEELPESGAGSEFNRKLREEARRKKYGIILKEFKAEDQPWILKVNGKAGRKYKGVKKGGVTENASYYIFTQCPDGAFEAFPVHHWYNFTPVAKHRTLTAEEAEEEWERRNKVLNHFSIMQQRRLKDQDEDEEEKEKKTKKKGSELRIHDLEEDLEMSSDESELSDPDSEKAAKLKKKPAPTKKKKKKKGSDDEAFEDSDDGDFEGQEVDYMSDASSSSLEEDVGKPKVTKEEDVPKGIDEASESSEESEEEKAPEEKEEEEEEKKAPTPQEKKKKKDSSDESETSEESDIDSETSSALFMAKKKTPPKKERKGSASSSRGNSRPGTPTADAGSTSSTLRAAANKLEQGKRQAGSGDLPAAKRLKLDAGGPQPTSGKSTPQPQSGKSTPSSGDVQLTEDAVRRYLTRKPMTTKDLLKKFQTKKTGLSSEQTVNVLAQILKRLNPERKMINDKMHFFLKE